jgi:hypothetical protein
MDKDSFKTVVLFRLWKEDGEEEIIALFPEQEGSGVGLVGSYMHIGQHGDADYFGMMDKTKPAKPSQYIDLKEELELIGYNLKVVKRGAQYLWWRQ